MNTKEIVKKAKNKKSIRSFNLSDNATNKLKRKAFQLTRTSRSVSGVLEAIIDFAMDNESDFDDHFRRGGKLDSENI